MGTSLTQSYLTFLVSALVFREPTMRPTRDRYPGRSGERAWELEPPTNLSWLVDHRILVFVHHFKLDPSGPSRSVVSSSRADMVRMVA